MVDWSTLPKDLLNLISKSLESSFDLLQFRSICSSWRSSAEPKPPLPTHHLPILPDNGTSLFPDSAVGFRLSQRSILLIKPPINESDLFGWLVKVEEDLNTPRKVTLLDPMSERIHSLPEHFPRSLDMSKFKVRELGREFKLHYFNTVGDIVNSLYLEKAVVRYLDSSKFVLLTIHVSGKLAVFTSWDRAWTVINDMPSPYDDVIVFNGRFFGVDNNGRTVVVDFVDLKLELVANPVYGGDKKFLIESCGEMLMVDMYLSMEEVDGDPGFGEEVFEHHAVFMNERTVKFKVFKFVEREKSWVEVKDLGDKMLFLGDDCTFTASASDLLPSCGGSSVFFNGNVFNEDNVDAMQDRDLGVFDFRSGKIELVHKLPEYAKLFWPPPPWITSHEVWLLITRTSTLVYTSNIAVHTQKVHNQMMMISTGLQRFLFTPSPQQGICYWGKELRTPMKVRCKAGAVPLMKQSHKFLSSLSSPALSADPNRHIKKFVAASPKSVSLNVLSHLLSPHSSHPHLSFFALSLYSEITQASWFDWNPKLIADLVALLNKQERFQESETLLSTAVLKLKPNERDFALFLCNLAESNSKQGSLQGFNEACVPLREIIQRSSSVYVKTQAYKSMVSGLCNMDQPHDAESVLQEMRLEKLKPGVFEYKSVLYSYGRLGLFDDMNRVVHRMETEGHRIDTVCSNMVLSSYGAHDALPQMASWLQKLKDLNVSLSLRTYNTVLNSCPTFTSLLKDLNSCPLSVSELLTFLNEDEVTLVRVLTQSSVLDEAIEWSSLEGKLDLHGMHLSSSYLIMMQWMDEIKARFSEEKCVVPAEIVAVSGSGKHSSVRGESPVKALVKKMMVRTGSPMRIDRKNVGSFIAKGKTVKEWLCQ